MPNFAANLTMLYNEHDFLDRFARRGQPTASPASSTCFPTPTRRTSWRRA